MQEFDIKGKVSVTAQVKAQMDDSPLALPPPQGFSDAETLQSLTEAQNSSADSLKYNTAIMKEFGNIMPDILKNFRAMNDIVARTNQNLPSVGRIMSSEEAKQKKIDDITGRSLLQLLNTGSGAVQSYANANVTGIAMGGLNGVSNLAGNAANLASLSGMAGLSKGVLLAGGLASAATAVLAGGNALADKFIDAMPTVYGTGRAFGSTSDARSLDYFGRINAYNRGTGLELDNFNALAQSLRRQGVGNGIGVDDQIGLVGNIARTTGRWAYATGGNADEYAQLAGLMSRYGGSNDVSKDFNYIVSAGKASGLNDTQIPEFLSGIQKVMEEGIAKGFATSATEVADTLLMFSKLSGNNAFWQGEQGAKLLNKANAGIASATSLSKTEDILVYAAMNDAYSDEDMRAILGKQGSYAEGAEYSNVMQMVERGIRPENFDNIMGYVTSRYTSTDDQIEALRNMTGLNYDASSQLRNLGLKALKGEEVSKTQLEEILNAPENMNKETRYQDAVNKIRDSVIRIGNGTAAIKISGMELLSGNVSKITNHILGNSKENKTSLSDNLNSLSAEDRIAVTEELPAFASAEEKNEIVTAWKTRQEWGGFGMMPGINSDAVYEDYESGALKKKIKWGRVFRDLEEMPKYINDTYGIDILNMFQGKTTDASNFMKALEGNKRFTDRVVAETKDASVSAEERKETVRLLKELVDQVKSGVTLNEMR